MARSCGGGHGGGGGGHSGGHHHHSGGSSSSYQYDDTQAPRGSSYSTYHPHRHSYVNRRGKRILYYTAEPVDIEALSKKEGGLTNFLIAIILFFFGVSVVIPFMGDISEAMKGCTKIDAYYADAIVIQDDAGVIADEELRGLTTALRDFGDVTGIIPYVYTVSVSQLDDFQRSSFAASLEDFAMTTYYALFNDEDHYLVLLVENGENWDWWAIQGDNTYPLLDDYEFELFQSFLQDALGRTTPGKALTAAFRSEWTEEVVTFSKLVFIGTAIEIVLSSPIFIIIIIALVAGKRSRNRDRRDEYEYYQEHGYPAQIDSIEASCPCCGTANPKYEEICTKCGANLSKY